MFGSSVVPDFDETMNIVRATSMARSTAAIWSGSVEVQHVKTRMAGAGPKLCAITSGPRLDPPMPISTTSRAVLGVARQRHQRGNIGPFARCDIEPAEPFVLIGAGPQGLIARPQAPDIAARRPLRERGVERLAFRGT